MDYRKLGDIWLDDETEKAFREWLQGLVKQRRARLARLEEENRLEALVDQRTTKMLAVAREYAERHGRIDWMSPYQQAQMAYTTWHEGAGYFDVDEHFEPDESDQELWECEYAEYIQRSVNGKGALTP